MTKITQYFENLNLSDLPPKAATYISNEILTDADIDLLDESDEDFVTIKNLISDKFPSAVRKLMSKEALAIIKPELDKMQEFFKETDKKLGRKPLEKEVAEQSVETNPRFERLKKIFPSLKQNDKGMYIPSSTNDQKYIINKAKKEGVAIEVVDSVNDLTDAYDYYITEKTEEAFKPKKAAEPVIKESLTTEPSEEKQNAIKLMEEIDFLISMSEGNDLVVLQKEKEDLESIIDLL